MNKITKFTVLFSIFILVLSACSISQQGGDTSTSPTEEMMVESDMNEENMETMDEDSMDTMSDNEMDTMDDEMMDDNHSDNMDSMDDENMDSGNDESMDMMGDTPDWFKTTLKNVNTGENFTIQDFHGKVVLVETMAIWCSNCLKQQTEVKSLYESMGMDSDLVVVVLDIDPNESGDALKEYAEKNNFSWVYAISPIEVSREISNLYGAQFVNPPSTPILIIDRDGVAHPLDFGLKNVEDLQNAVDMYLNDM